MNSLETAKFMADVLDNKIAGDIKVIQVDNLTSVTDYFIICTATSPAHVKALRDEVDMKMTEKNVEPNHREIDSENWMVLDYGDVILHIFDEVTRETYNLELLWSEATTIEI